MTRYRLVEDGPYVTQQEFEAYLAEQEPEDNPQPEDEADDEESEQ